MLKVSAVFAVVVGIAGPKQRRKKRERNGIK